MADVTLQRVGELLRVVFEVLWYKPDGLPAQDILVHIPRAVQLTEFETTYYPSTNVPRYQKIIRFATIPLVKIGWLVKNNKGRWYITDEGREACKKFSDAQEFYKEALHLYNERRQSGPAVSLMLEEVGEKAWGQICKYLLEKKPFEFQTLVVNLLEAMDYHIAWVAPPSKDHGRIDIVAHTDPIGANGPRIIVQVKHIGQATTVEGLRAFTSTLSGEDYGLFVASGGFTNDAKELARAHEHRNVILIDLENFFDLWVEYYQNLTQEARQRFPLKEIYFLSPSE